MRISEKKTDAADEDGNEERKSSVTDRDTRITGGVIPGDGVSTVACRSVAQSCFKDGLQLIYRFCSVRDMVSASHSCREWSLASHSGKSRFLCVTGPGMRFVNFVRSPLAFLVTRVSDAPRQTWSLADLEVLASCTTGIMSIAITIDGTTMQFEVEQRAQMAGANKTPQPHLSFPSTLQEAWIQFRKAPGASTPLLQAQHVLMASFASATGLLSVSLQGMDSSLDLVPLLSCTSLHTLALRGHIVLPASKYAVLRQMSSLTHLRANRDMWTADQLALLLDPTLGAHQLTRLAEIGLGLTDITPGHMENLMHRESLTALESNNIDAEAVTALPQLVALQSLVLTVDAHLHGHTQGVIFAAPLAQCTRLRRLTLHRVRLSASAAETVCAGLAECLEELVLHDVRLISLESLSGLHRLQQLALWRCRRIDSTHVVAHLQSLTSLRDLTIADSLMPPLTPEVIQSLTPPSAIMPGLLVMLAMPGDGDELDNEEEDEDGEDEEDEEDGEGEEEFFEDDEDAEDAEADES